MVLTIERIASGLSNSRSKWMSEYCRMSNRLSMLRMNRNLRNAATISAKRRQHDHDDEIDDREAEREIAPGPSFITPGRNALPATVM